MKLAEALAERGDCQKRIDQLRSRLSVSVRIQEGDKPPEDPDSLLAEAERVYARQLQLIQMINRTNSATQFDNSRTISDAIVERDVLSKQRQFIASIADAAAARQDRYTKSEVKFIATVSIGDLQKQADEMARRFRELDTRIQELNWKTDCV